MFHAVFLIERLIVERNVGISALDGILELLFHDELSLFDNRDVEMHLQVGGTCAMLGIDHQEGMRRIIVEGVAVEESRLLCSIFGPGRTVRKDTGQLKAFLDRRVDLSRAHIVINDLTVLEIDRADGGRVDPAKIQHQHAVHVDPQVVVAGKFIDDRLTLLQTAVGHHKAEVDGHAEEVIDRLLSGCRSPVPCCTGLVDHFAEAGILKVQRCHVLVIRVGI